MKILEEWCQKAGLVMGVIIPLCILYTGQFSEAGLHQCMPFVIFHARSRSVTSRPISEEALLHTVYSSGS